MGIYFDPTQNVEPNVSNGYSFVGKSSFAKLQIRLSPRSGTWTAAITVASSPGPTQKIGKGAWCHLQKFPYVLCQQSLFGIEESRSSITNY